MPSVGLDRDYAVALCEAYLPATGYTTVGQVGFDHIVKDWTGGGTTCGFLVHWLLWKLGCLETPLVNRYEPDTRLNYVDGSNISRVSGFSRYQNYAFGGKTANDQFLNGSRRPRRGDCVIIDTEHYTNAHIFVMLDDGQLVGDTLTCRVAQAGQSVGAKKVQGAHIKTRRFQYKAAPGAWLELDSMLSTPVNRYIRGWLDLSVLVFDRYPDFSWEPFACYSQLPSTGSPLASTVVGCWAVSDPGHATGWYYLFVKGHRVYYSDGANGAMLLGAGYWHTDGGTVHVEWATEAHTQETHTLFGNAGLGVDGYGAVLVLQRTSIPPHLPTSFVNGLGLPPGPKMY